MTAHDIGMRPRNLHSHSTKQRDCADCLFCGGWDVHVHVTRGRRWCQPCEQAFAWYAGDSNWHDAVSN